MGTKEKETDLLKIKESEQAAEIKSLKNQKVENDEKLSKSQAESELAEAHAHSLAKEVDAMDQSPSQLQAKTDAKLLEAEMNTLKKSPTISLGPSEPPKDLNTVVPLGEQLQ